MDGVKAHGKRFEKSTLRKGDGFRELVAHLRGVVGELHQGAIEVGESLCATPESQVRADIVSPLFAECAFPTWQAYFQCDTVSNLEVGHIRSRRRHSASRFVA